MTVDSGLDFGCCPGNGYIILADKAKAVSAMNRNGMAFILLGKGQGTGIQSRFFSSFVHQVV
jgi:hypothetical protein